MPDRTPAEELTAAADKLDALLGDTAPGPWRLGIMWGTVINAGHANVTRDTFPGDAEYIAAMNPDVGRALVALLRAACDGNDIDGYDPEQVEHYFAEELAVARAILATKEGT